MPDGNRHRGGHHHRWVVAHDLTDRLHDHLVERLSLGQRERSDRRTAQVAQVGPSPKGMTEIVGQGADVGARGAVDLSPQNAGLALDLAQRETVDRHRPMLSLHLDALAGQVVQAPPVHFHGRHHRRDLKNVPGECCRRRLRLFEGDPGHVVAGHHVAARVQGRGLGAQHDLADVGLGQGGEEAQQTGGPAHPEQQDAGGVGVERAGMADLLVVQDPAGLGHDIVRRPPGVLVDDGDAVPELLVSLHRVSGVDQAGFGLFSTHPPWG